MVYGVGHGARYHFGQSVSDLGPAWCATLAAILPGPRVAYNPRLKPVKVQKRAKRILRRLRGRRVLTAADYAAAVAMLEGRPAEPPEEEASLEETPEVDLWDGLKLETPDLGGEPSGPVPWPALPEEQPLLPPLRGKETAPAGSEASGEDSVGAPIRPEPVQEENTSAGGGS